MLLRWGLLGTARINRLLIPAIRATGRSVVHSVASRDPARAAAYAAGWEIPRVDSYDGLLGSDIDIVYVPLPNSLHVPWTVRALEAGKHVLCEKPLALSPEGVDAVADASARSGRIATEGFMYRHHALTRRVQEVVSSGGIGEVRSIAGAFSYPRSREDDVRLDPNLGGGALWDVGCYPVSYAQLIAGADVASVTGRHQLGPTGVDEQFSAVITYANGASAQASASFRDPYRTFMRIVGTVGTIEIARPFRPEPIDAFSLTRDGVRDTIEVVGHPIFVDEIFDIEDAALGGKPPRMSLGESRTLATTLGALIASARTGRPIHVHAQ